MLEWRNFRDKYDGTDILDVRNILAQILAQAVKK